MRSGDGLAGQAFVGERGIRVVCHDHIEPLHPLAAVLDIFHEHARRGGIRHVQIAAERPDDVAVAAVLHKGVLFVRVVAVHPRRVLHVHLRRLAGIGVDRRRIERDRPVRGREAVVGSVRDADDLLGERAVVVPRHGKVYPFLEDVAAGEAFVLAAIVRIGHGDGEDLVWAQLPVPEKEFADFHARTSARAVPRAKPRRDGGGKEAAEHVGRARGDRERVDAEGGRRVRYRDGDMPPPPVRGRHLGRHDPLAVEAHHEVRAAAFQPPVDDKTGCAGLHGKDCRLVRSRRFVLVAAHPERDRPAGLAKVRARRQLGVRVRAGEVDGVVVRVPAVAGAAFLRGDRDLRAFALCRPADRIHLRKRRYRDRLGHALFLDRRVPPDLDARIPVPRSPFPIPGHRRDGVDDAVVGVRVAVVRDAGHGVCGDAFSACFGARRRVEIRVPDARACRLVDVAGAFCVAMG